MAQSCQQEPGIWVLTSQFSAEENNEKDRELGNMNKVKEVKLLILKNSMLWERDDNNNPQEGIKLLYRERELCIFHVYSQQEAAGQITKRF